MFKKFFIPLILILSIILITLIPNIMAETAETINSKSRQYIFNEISNTLQKGNPGWNSWFDGIKEEFGGELKDISFKLNFLDEKEDHHSIFILTELIITAFFINKNGEKERIVRQRLIIYLCDLETGKPIQFTLIKEYSEFLKGWNGCDI